MKTEDRWSWNSFEEWSRIQKGGIVSANIIVSDITRRGKNVQVKSCHEESQNQANMSKSKKGRNRKVKQVNVVISLLLCKSIV